MNGVNDPTSYKESLRLSDSDLIRLNRAAKEIVAELAERYPKARDIDLLNAFLRAFTKRMEPPKIDPETIG